MSGPAMPSRREGVSYLYMLAAFVVVVAGMRAAEPILNPLLLAVFLSVICAPGYLWLLRRGLSQWISLLIVAGTLSAVVVVLLGVVMQSISSFTTKQAHYQEQIPLRLNELKDDVMGWLPDMSSSKKPVVDPEEDSVNGGEAADSDSEPTEDVSSEHSPDATSADDNDEAAEPENVEADQVVEVTGNVEDAEDAAAKDPEDPELEPAVHEPPPEEEPLSFTDQLYQQIQDQFNPSTVLSLAGRLAGSLRNLLSNALLIMLTVVFILLEVGSFREKLNHAFERSGETTRQAEQMVHSMQRYMAIKTVVSLVTAVLIGFWLRIFDVPFIALWMLLAFLLNFIPNIGSIIAAIPAVLIAWLEFGITPALGCAVGYVFVNVVIGNLVEPRLMGRDLGLSPLVIFCSMIFWGWVLGPVGMLLSVPLTMVVHIMLSDFDDTRWIATLMGGRVSGD